MRKHGPRRRQGPNGVCPTPFVTHYPISVIGRIEAIHEGESRRGLLGQSPRDRPPAGALAPTRIDTLVTRSAVSVIGKTKIRNEDKSGRAPLGPTPGVPTRTQRHGRDGHATGNVAQGPLSGPAAPSGLRRAFATHGEISMNESRTLAGKASKAGERALRYVWLAVVHGCGDGGANAQ